VRAKALNPEDIEEVTRGSGITSLPLFGEWSGAGQFTTGMTVFPPGKGIAMHHHNVEETVVVVDGSGVAVIDDEELEVGQYSATWIPPNVPHRFYNSGDKPMRILWVYGGVEVTRTLTDSGETFVHMSESDRQVGQEN